MNRILFLLPLLFFSLGGRGQDYISRQDAVEDIQFFVETVEKTHPNIYDKIDKRTFKSYLTNLKDTLPSSISVSSFSKEMRILSNLFKDGHTKVSFSRDVSRKYRIERCRLPFKIRVSNDSIFIGSTEVDELVEGDIILSINGIGFRDLIDLKRYPVVDIQETALSWLEEYFDYYLFVEYEFIDSLEMKILRDDNVIECKVPLSSIDSTKSEKEPIYSYKVVNDTTFIISITTFSNKSINKGEYQSFLDRVFAEIERKKINTLFLDLRENGGGNSRYGYTLFPYINAKEYKATKLTQIKTSHLAKTYFRKQYIKWYLYPLFPFAYFTKYGRALFFKKNGTLTNFMPKVEKVKPSSNAFSGKVFVLVSKKTYSAAATFISAFRFAKRGVIVGETMGQPYSGYIDKVPFLLPHSHLNAAVSFKKYEYLGTTEQNRHQGIEPDILFSQDDFISEQDYLEAILHLD